MRLKQKESAFTMVEILVAVAVIGILAAMLLAGVGKGKIKFAPSQV